MYEASLVAQMIVYLQCRRSGFNPWVGKIPWRRAWQSTPVFLPGGSHRQRSLVGYSPWGSIELDMTEWLTHTQCIYVNPNFPICPPFHFPVMSTCPFFMSASLFLPWKKVHLYHFSRVHINVLTFDICFSGLVHSVWQTLDPPTSLQMTLFCSF